MNLLEFLIQCRQAWLLRKRVYQTINAREGITIPNLSKSLLADQSTVSLAVTVLMNSGEVFIIDPAGIGQKGRKILSPKYVSRGYLFDKEAEKERLKAEKERLKAEKERFLERVRQALPEEEFTIPGLALKLKEDSYAVMEALTELPEVKDTGRSIQASDGSNIFFPTYIKSKPA